jgi:hypothetical protein
MPEPKKSSNIDDFEYQYVDSEEKIVIAKRVADYVRMLTDVASTTIGLEKKALKIDGSSVQKIVALLERERVYSKVFEGLEMSEFTETVLRSYWTMKYRPFFRLDKHDASEVLSSKINLEFASGLLHDAICLYLSNRGAVTAPFVLRDAQKIFSDNNFEELSKDAFLFLITTLADHLAADITT